MNIMSIFKSDRSFHVWLFLGILCSVLGMTSTVRASTAQAVSNKFINSIATNDFMSLFSVYSIYQDRIADIRSNNPKVLWKRLEDEYYSKEKTDYENRAVNNDFTWNAFLSGNSLNIPYWKKVFNTGKYSAIEEKQENGFSPKTGRNISYTIVYYNYVAPDAMSSMPLNDKLVKEFIFSVQVSSGKVFGVETLTNSYTYWPSTDENKMILAKMYASDNTSTGFKSGIRVLKDATEEQAVSLRNEYEYRTVFIAYVNEQGFYWHQKIRDIYKLVNNNPQLTSLFMSDSRRLVEKNIARLNREGNIGEGEELILLHLHDYFSNDPYFLGNYIRVLLFNTLKYVGDVKRAGWRDYFHDGLEDAMVYAGTSATAISIAEQLRHADEKAHSEGKDSALIEQIRDAIIKADAIALSSKDSKYYRSQDKFYEYIELRPDNVIRYHEYSDLTMKDIRNNIGTYQINGDKIAYTRVERSESFGGFNKKETLKTDYLKYDGKSITDPDGEQYILIE